MICRRNPHTNGMINFRHYKNCPGSDLKKSIENRGFFCENKYNKTKNNKDCYGREAE